MNLTILNKGYFRKTMTVLQCVQKKQSCSVSECLTKTTLLCLSFTHLTQLFLNGKVSSTILRPAKARHLLFLLDMGGVIPGKLGAGLHNSDTDRKDRNQFPMKKNSHPLLSYLLVKKAMTGKARSWESVKTFWRKRFGWQLCCREQKRSQKSNVI